MESSLRAFLLLMFLLAAGVAGVSSSTRSTAGRLLADHHGKSPAERDFHIVCGTAQHFLFVAPLRNAAMTASQGATALASREPGPRPARVQPADAFLNAPQDLVCQARPIPSGTPSGTLSGADLQPPRHLVAFSGAQGGVRGGIKPCRDRASANVADGNHNPWDALSYDFAATWNLDPDQSQVALVYSLCGNGGGLARPSVLSKHQSFPVGRIQSLVTTLLGGRPEPSRWIVGLKVTWIQFCNWLQYKHLSHNSIRGVSAEETAEPEVLTPEEYAQLIQTVTVPSCAPGHRRSEAALARGDSP